ncbi:hypothetical protein AMAG_08071 [Allomyces macrogynus ATCC 38327]|uniref:Uncharacterized protein n=1 Tax=Allomyces macrogynus (strain ATCC 38327) TaxID=578462 RepID=A0A0L0SKA4_ALLM3|nr:hypothetical protein AMAG_08071 [Allomyces macrogynus ATCC 38327]|eukprot:KNE62893.1 hypothetical protein AMAG_08071 [Allomyces macrogynus ATCC 38327]
MDSSTAAPLEPAERHARASPPPPAQELSSLKPSTASTAPPLRADWLHRSQPKNMSPAGGEAAAPAALPTAPASAGGARNRGPARARPSTTAAPSRDSDSIDHDLVIEALSQIRFRKPAAPAISPNWTRHIYGADPATILRAPPRSNTSTDTLGLETTRPRGITYHALHDLPRANRGAGKPTPLMGVISVGVVTRVDKRADGPFAAVLQMLAPGASEALVLAFIVRRKGERKKKTAKPDEATTTPAPDTEEGATEGTTAEATPPPPVENVVVDEYVPWREGHVVVVRNPIPLSALQPSAPPAIALRATHLPILGRTPDLRRCATPSCPRSTLRPNNAGADDAHCEMHELARVRASLNRRMELSGSATVPMTIAGAPSDAKSAADPIARAQYWWGERVVAAAESRRGAAVATSAARKKLIEYGAPFCFLFLFLFLYFWFFSESRGIVTDTARVDRPWPSAAASARSTCGGRGISPRKGCKTRRRTTSACSAKRNASRRPCRP